MTDDADRAQAHVFLRLLSAQAATLDREITTHGTTTTAGRRRENELQDVRRYMDRLQRRFPDTARR